MDSGADGGDDGFVFILVIPHRMFHINSKFRPSAQYFKTSES